MIIKRLIEDVNQVYWTVYWPYSVVKWPNLLLLCKFGYRSYRP